MKYNAKDFESKYEYGFHDTGTDIFTTGKGINEEVIKVISAKKGEPQWMLDFRLKAYNFFKDKPNPKFGPDLNFINFDDYVYYVKSSKGGERKWTDVPEKIKKTFEKLGLPEAEQKFLAGVETQYDSEVVYSSMLKEVEEKGIIFTDTDSALKNHPELFKKFFGTVVPYTDNKYAALNSAVWSGGSFIYVPKNVKLDKPLQAYFRINYKTMGQFERTLIIVDEGAEINYVEGCTAPVYTENNLHAAVVEIIVHKNAKCRYTTIQNWSENVLNLVTKRSIIHEAGDMQWIDGNLGSGINMKYPCCVMVGKNATASTISIAVAKENMIQDSGAKMIHLAPNTKSSIISKTIALNGGISNYRGLVKISENALNSFSHVECDTLLLDDISKADTIPTEIMSNQESNLEHEATVSKISEEQLYYLMSRGISEEDAKHLIVMGFIEPFSKELPMEYAVELNRLVKLDMEGSIG